MHTGKTVFAQITNYLPIRRFHTLVKRYNGEYKVKAFSCLDQLLTMIFAQLAACDSLRDIEACLSANPKSLYHLGIRSRIRRSTLADANEKRDTRIFEDFAKTLVVEARKLYAGKKPLPEIDAVVYAFDSTTISLCLELFPWAEFHKGKAGIKLHTLIDIRGNIPSFVLLSQAKMHNVKALDLLPVEPGCVYLVDKGYIDFSRLFRIHQAEAFFVTRLKDNARYRVVKSQAVDKTTGVLCDQITRLAGVKSSAAYPERLRRVKYRDVETGIVYEFLSNNFILSAYLLLTIVRQCLSLSQELHEITQNLRLHLFEKMPVLSMFFEQPLKNNTTKKDKQLVLFD